MRTFIATLALACGLGASSASAQITATVAVGAQSYLFDCATGTDKGDYVDPQGQFTQGDVAVTRADSPLTVECRQDKTSAHVELVFTLFKAYGAANAAGAHLGPYTVTVRNGASTVATIPVPNHWWGSRWRTWSNDGLAWNVGGMARPLRQTAAGLITSKAVLPYALQWKAPTPVNWTHYVYASPMDSAGVYFNMPDTGGRPDIGPQTEWVAQYLINPTAAGASAIVSISEAAGSIPIHVRDENTGAPIDLIAHKTADWYANSGGPLVGGPAHIQLDLADWLFPAGRTRTPWHTDSSHFPDLDFVPFQLTGDPYYLEEMQYVTTWAMGDQGNGAVDATGGRLIPQNEEREWAWTFRSLIETLRSTPTVTPSWLLGKVYWQTIANTQLAHMQSAFVNNPAIQFSVFRAWSKQPPELNFQDDFVAYETGNAVYMGFPEWKPVFDWRFAEIMARTNGTSGWNRQSPSIYGLVIGPATTWAQLYAQYVTQESASMIAPTDTTSFIHVGYADYLVNNRFSLAVGTLLGESGAASAFAFVDGMAQKVGYMTGAMSIGVNGAVSPPPVVTPPPVVVPPPVVTPPPVVVPPKFTVGQRVQSTVVLNVRQTADGAFVGYELAGAVATVLGGPSTAATGSVWWNVRFDNGVTGWSAETFLAAAPVVLPPPPVVIPPVVTPPPVVVPPAPTHHLIETLDGKVILDTQF